MLALLVVAESLILTVSSFSMMLSSSTSTTINADVWPARIVTTPVGVGMSAPPALSLKTKSLLGVASPLGSRLYVTTVSVELVKPGVKNTVNTPSLVGSKPTGLVGTKNACAMSLSAIFTVAVFVPMVISGSVVPVNG